jgi:hypothetical protein
LNFKLALRPVNLESRAGARSSLDEVAVLSEAAQWMGERDIRLNRSVMR